MKGLQPDQPLKPTRQAINLTDLNQFTILASRPAADSTQLTGRLSRPGSLGPGDTVRLFITLEDDVLGQVSQVDPDAGTAVLSVLTEHVSPAIITGTSLPLYDDYWYDGVHLVLDIGLRWTRTQFVAPDAFIQDAPMPGWRQSRAAKPGDEGRADGTIVPGGWDHEHCGICWRHIGSGGDPEGYVTGSNEWVCTSCYRRYVEPRDLAFVLEGTDDRSDNEPFEAVSRLIDEYDLGAVRDYLSSQGQVDVRSRSGWTPLMIAAWRGQGTLVELLLHEGADVNAVAEPQGYAALAMGAQAGHAKIVELLLNAGARPRVPEYFFGGSLLGYVKSGRGRTDQRIADLLARAGAT
ncbi:MAG TPA: ankyrin repeat domain-containing protein [Tepidisphaeraceae bacterium]|nr:ankyrin repeat domain-containing protein [Tepidisphaeraceae bacterium]